VPPDAGRQGMEVKRQALQQALDRLTEEAEARSRGDGQAVVADVPPRSAQ
jgi:hypothetical protein